MPKKDPAEIAIAIYDAVQNVHLDDVREAIRTIFAKGYPFDDVNGLVQAITLAERMAIAKGQEDPAAKMQRGLDALNAALVEGGMDPLSDEHGDHIAEAVLSLREKKRPKPRSTDRDDLMDDHVFRDLPLN